MTRMHLYTPISNRLAFLSDVELKKILANADAMHVGIGGKSSLISIEELINSIIFFYMYQNNISPHPKPFPIFFAK
jgi:hypothetical protein